MKRGDRLGGKYRLLHRLAAGGMGEVWVAQNETTAAQVALKIRKPNPGSNMDMEARFRQEARISAMLAHRNIVRVFDLFHEDDGTLVLVMELLRGESLQKRLTRGVLPIDESVAVVIPILSALSHAHKLGIVHRDITPGNIFLAVDPDGHVTPKLVDFGIAKVSSTEVKTLEGYVLGTPRYMSPEQIRGESVLEGRSDLFSVAIVLYECITGASPFAATTPSASLAAVLETTVDPDARISPQLWLVIQQALSKRPYERPSDAAEMSRLLCESLSTNAASLAQNLRWHGPAPEPFISTFGDTAGETTGGQSLHVPAPTRRLSWRHWLVGAFLFAMTALVIFAAIRGSRQRSSAQPNIDEPSHDSAASAPSNAPSESVALSPPLAASSSPSASVATPSTTPGRKAPRAPGRTRPVATTPGF